jgi:hypothetical protein
MHTDHARNSIFPDATLQARGAATDAQTHVTAWDARCPDALMAVNFTRPAAANPGLARERVN